MRRLRLIALGAALAYFFDPANGPERRKVAIKKLAKTADRIRAKVKAPQPEDEVLARKVEAELFGSGLTQDKIDVNAESGKVVLSGEADSPEMIDELVSRARQVDGVEEVESLLEAPTGPASASTPE